MIKKNDIQAFSETCRVLEGAEDYIYLLPHPGLRDWISNYTITFPVQGLLSDCYTIVPHGCATMVCSCNGTGICSYLFGPLTRPCMVGAQANQMDMLFIIEFQPGGLYGLTGVKQKELTDTVIPLASMNVMLDRRIAEKLEQAQSVYELVISLDRLLLSHLHPLYPAEFSCSLQSVIKNKGNISVKELSGSVYYSERHLNRIFDQYLGMSVKAFSRLVRINRAARLLHNPEYSITQACDTCGFYDLSHFIHQFQSICGITPQKYRDRMSDFYSEIAKF